ncbi:MAG: hypothetical protein D6754_15190 [Alphaproteobacteria bacterium]|nr:MAG: hypothetical protein D6754_15190 [Alphaproteobacteria bacterium]
MIGLSARCRRGLAAALCLANVATAQALLPSPLRAGEVTVKSFDGSVSVTGRFLGLRDGIIRLDTAVGPLSIDAFLVSCSGADCPPPEAMRPVLRIGATRELAGSLVPALIAAYAEARGATLEIEPLGPEETRFTLRHDGAGRPFAVIRLGTDTATATPGDPSADAARISLTASPGDAAEGARSLALDGLAVIVAPDNPVTSIPLARLADVFAGRIDNWARLGGPDAPVNLYLDAAGGDIRRLFEARVMRRFGLQPGPEVNEIADAAELSDRVAADPFGIGVVDTAFLRNARALALELGCGLAVEPDAFSIRAGDYPLTHAFWLRAGGKLGDPGRDLTGFMLSEAAQAVIADAGFVDRGVAGLAIDRQGRRLANTLLSAGGRDTAQLRELVGIMRDASRLSLTFRRTAGGDGFDARARADIALLARLMSEGELKGRRLVLIGFTDAIGRDDLNRTLSRRWAAALRDAVIAAAPPGTLDAGDFTVLGFGELSPLGCNEDAEGRRINRRVEVWLPG